LILPLDLLGEREEFLGTTQPWKIRVGRNGEVCFIRDVVLYCEINGEIVAKRQFEAYEKHGASLMYLTFRTENRDNILIS
jgi:hypothetical protein